MAHIITNSEPTLLPNGVQYKQMLHEPQSECTLLIQYYYIPQPLPLLPSSPKDRALPGVSPPSLPGPHLGSPQLKGIHPMMPPKKLTLTGSSALPGAGG